MNLKEWKNKLAIDTYKMSWDELSIDRKFRLAAKHRVQFYTLAHQERKNRQGKSVSPPIKERERD